MRVPEEVRAGDLSKTSFPKVLWELFRNQAHGLLEVKRKDVVKKIYFADGQPVSAESNLLHETLGKYLISEEVISPEREQQALIRALEIHKPFGEVLVELGAVDAAQLYENLKKSLALKILDCFSWEEGSFRFDSAEQAPDTVANFKMNTVRLLLRGIDTVFPEARMFQNGISANSSYRVTANSPVKLEDLQLTTEEVKLLNLMKNAKTAKELAPQGQMTDSQVTRKIFAFWLMGLVFEAEHGAEMSLDELVSATLLQSLQPTEEERTLDQVDEGTRELANEIASDHLKMMNLNYFELLSVPETASAVEIRDKFIEFAGRYNPARFKTGQVGEFRGRGEELFLRGVKAFASLSDFDSKVKYLDKIKAERKKISEAGKKKPGEAFKIETKLLDANSQFEQGLRFLKDKKYAKAIEFFQYCLDIDSNNPSYLAHMAWSMFQSSPERNSKTAEEMLKRALGLGSNSYGSYFYGKLLTTTGRADEALPHFKLAVDLEPKNIDMIRELRAADRKK